MAYDSTEWAWRDLEISLDGVRVGKCSKFTSKTTRESEHIYGEGDDPYDINPGNKAYTGEIEIPGTIIAKMNLAARAKGGDDLTDVIWTLGCKFKPTATDPKQKIVVPNVRFDEFEEGGANNEKVFKKTLPYKSLRPVPMP